MDNATEPLKPAKKGKRRFRGKVTPRVKVEDQVVKVAVPEGSRFKGHEPFLVQDLVISAKATCYQRERWVTPDGRTILAPLPEGIEGHFGPELRRFVLMLEAAAATPADGQTRKLRRRSPGCPARRAGDIAVCVGGRYRCAPCRQERVLHADRQ